MKSGMSCAVRARLVLEAAVLLVHSLRQLAALLAPRDSRAHLAALAANLHVGVRFACRLSGPRGRPLIPASEPTRDEALAVRDVASE
jgi:hypothetical protein